MKVFMIILACLACVGVHAELFFTPEMIATHLETYTDQEIELIEKDLQVVRSVCFSDVKNADTPFYLATAGGPGAFKTTTLEKFVASHPEYQGGVYLDPDQRSLKFMVHTYYAKALSALVISQEKNYDQVIKNAYDKWRGGSNYIALKLFEEAAAQKHSLVYGGTSTGAHIPKFFERLKENGYQIILLLCSCPDSLRQEGIEYRNQTIRFYQSSPEDAITKGKFFPQRMKVYFDYANVLFFYWNDDMFSPERLAAVWQNGKLEIHDSEAMQRFIEKYEADRLSLSLENNEIPPFESYL